MIILWKQTVTIVTYSSAQTALVPNTDDKVVSNIKADRNFLVSRQTIKSRPETWCFGPYFLFYESKIEKANNESFNKVTFGYCPHVYGHFWKESEEFYITISHRPLKNYWIGIILFQSIYEIYKFKQQKFAKVGTRFQKLLCKRTIKFMNLSTIYGDIHVLQIDLLVRKNMGSNLQPISLQEYVPQCPMKLRGLKLQRYFKTR